MGSPFDLNDRYSHQTVFAVLALEDAHQGVQTILHIPLFQHAVFFNSHVSVNMHNVEKRCETYLTCTFRYLIQTTE